MRLDIFCQVIDNFGDAGVCLRLARQLIHEYALNIRLIIDQPDILKKLSPTPVKDLAVFSYDQCPKDVADVVIEGFGCQLPLSYLKALEVKKPIWINMEYLSAEKWIEECHQLASVYENGLKKYFFFPGFTPKTGGIIREKNPITPFDKKHFLESLGVYYQDKTLISLFCYESAPVLSLIHSLSNAHLLVPEGVATKQINESFLQKGDLIIQRIPFVSQEEYDLLLHCCDVNFVRGEDSFVRAQLAQKPFVWQIYPQEDGVHLVKLNAFLERYLTHFPTQKAALIQKTWLNWNQPSQKSHFANIIDMAKDIEIIQGAQKWSGFLLKSDDFASNLYRFILNLR